MARIPASLKTCSNLLIFRKFHRSASHLSESLSALENGCVSLKIVLEKCGID